MELLALATDWGLFAGLAAGSSAGLWAFFKGDHREDALDRISGLHKNYHHYS